MEAITKTRKIGGSIVVTLPAQIVKSEQIQEDELVEINVKKVKRDYFGALKGIGRFTKEDRAKGQIEE